MAQRFIEQATQQIDPLYTNQIKTAESQIPAIQQLYDTLTQGLNAQSQKQIQTGTQDILESASARGVLRSTLPVDAQQTLQAEIGSALQQSMGQLGLQRTQDIGRVQSDISNLRLGRMRDIQSLTDTLMGRDQNERSMQLEREKMALARAEMNRPTNVSTKTEKLSDKQIQMQLKASLNQNIANAFKSPGASKVRFTEDELIPALVDAFPELSPQEIVNSVYSARKILLGS